MCSCGSSVAWQNCCGRFSSGYSSGGYCSIHGAYIGYTCPGCATTPLPAHPLPAYELSPASPVHVHVHVADPELVERLERLERFVADLVAILRDP